MTPNINQPVPPLAVTPKKDPVDLLVGCAIQSFVEALVALIWGRLVFSILDDIVGDMIPTLPPGMAEVPAAHHQHGNLITGWFGTEHHQLWIISAVFFILNLRAAVAGPLLTTSGRQTRLQRVARNLREEGLNLLFGNAIGAMIAAYVASLITNFSWSQVWLHWLFDATAPTLNQWANQVFGSTHVGIAQDWWNWWGQNQLKFSFWLFYLTAICDDLGIPNLKTLARFSWRRLRLRLRFSAPPLPPSGQQSA